MPPPIALPRLWTAPAERTLLGLRLGALAGTGLLLAFVPHIVSSYWVTILTYALIYAILAMGLNLLMGYTGLDSLGQAAFFGLGSYGLGILTVKYGVGWWPAAAAAIGIGAAGAAFMGLIAVRLKGLYFLLVTLAMGQVLWGADYRWGTFTGGANGLEFGGGRPSSWFYDDTHFYYATLVVFGVVAALLYVIIVSPFGLTLKGIRERELRSTTLGYRTYTHKHIAFVIAGVTAAVAGVLSGAYNGIASPSDLTIDNSFTAMLMVILGGSGTIAGPIAGAFGITALKYELSSLWVDYWPIILGAVYVVMTVYVPNGVIGGAGALWRRLGAPRQTSDPEPPAASSQPLGDIPENQAAVRAGLGATRRRPDQKRDGTALELTGVSKAFDDLQVLSGIDLTVRTGERVGIIGLNGAGKTTLFHVISGIEPPSHGRVALLGHDVTKAPPNRRAALGLSRTFQVTLLYPRLTVAENMDVALLGSRYRRYRFRMWRPLGTHHDLRARAGALLEAVGLLPYRDAEVRHLSYGHQRQLEIALALASEPELLLLDEPTAGLSHAEISEMRRLLASLPRDLTVLIVEHHLEVIFEFVERVLVLHQGETILDAPPDAVRQDARVQDLYFGSHAAAHVGAEGALPVVD